MIAGQAQPPPGRQIIKEWPLEGLGLVESCLRQPGHSNRRSPSTPKSFAAEHAHNRRESASNVLDRNPWNSCENTVNRSERRSTMAPTPTSRPSPPEPRLYSRAYPATLDDEVVISGMAGKFPRCENVQAFKDNLYNKVTHTYCKITKYTRMINLCSTIKMMK